MCVYGACLFLCHLLFAMIGSVVKSFKVPIVEVGELAYRFQSLLLVCFWTVFQYSVVSLGLNGLIYRVCVQVMEVFFLASSL